MKSSESSKSFIREVDNESCQSENNTDEDNPIVDYEDNEPFIKHQIPVDRYNIAFLVFYLLGINTLIPWNFFITADDYWKYKFREINESEPHISNLSRMDLLSKRTDLQASFTAYLSVSSAIPNSLFLIINAFISKKLSLSTRMIGSQGVILAVFIVTTSFAKVNTDKYQNTFLIITLTSVAIVNAANAIFGGSLMGVAGKFSSKYITAMSSGQALGGIFTALTEILSLWIGANPISSGLLYFTIGDVVLLLSLISYIILEREVFFKHHVIIGTEVTVQSEFSINNENNFSGESISYSSILRKTWPYGLSVFLVFFFTISVYPAVTVLIESQGKGHGILWNDVYFVPVVTYLIFSCGDYVGRIISGMIIWPKKKPGLLVFLSLLRLLFIPAFLFCNAQPRHHLPVYIHNDVIYMVLTFVFALTNGYFCNVSFILAPTVVDENEREIAAAMLGAFIGVGLTAGSTLSLLIVKLL
ncbi:equilibrative nucleoside transporter 3 [Copidosoma floridanum]|uniref:equilibrative nucleoside transporter 3 n=1 Tax=Copidosoma floridanum TaxID=29053 RepID=UPI0006C9DAAB|nr:equilibrative nucleoside transporter 3 [Copidosoma floridanum]